MASDVSAILEGRLAQAADGPFRRALAIAGTLHLLVAVAALVLPRLLASPARPLEFVAVSIVPAAKLGVEKPRPAPPAPVEAKKPEPAPERKPESKAPVLPDPKLKAKPAEKARPAPQSPVANAPAAAQPEVQGTARGVASGLALGASAATFDNPDFTYGYYVDQMLALISRNWSRPPVGSGVEAMIHYKIQRDGRISDIRIALSSGINSFDLAALRAVQASSPLPPLPRAYRESSLGVNLIVR